MFRADRPISDDHERGGGVCILTNNNTVRAIAVSLPLQYKHCEMCVIDVLFGARDSLRLFGLYRPPGYNRNAEALNYAVDLYRCIDFLYVQQQTNIICGDFNLPDIDWSLNNCLRCNDFTVSGLFLSLYYKYSLEQLVNVATRNNNILDLIFTNDMNTVVNVSVDDPFSNSDHSTVSFNVFITSNSVPETSRACDARIVYNFDNADWRSINLYLSHVDFDYLFVSYSSVVDVFTAFYNVLYDCISLYVPVKRVGKTRKPHYPYYIQRLVRKKAAAWRQYRSRTTLIARTRYNKAAAVCRRETRAFVARSERRLIDKGNLGAFYRHANKKFCTKTAIGPIRDKSNILNTDPLKKAEILNETFCSYFTKNDGNMPVMSAVTSAHLQSVDFSPNFVHKAIQKLKTNASGGPDIIPPVFFKNCREELAYPLSILFTLSFKTGYIPPSWSSAYISPIYKKGDKVDPCNYRPIALTCTMCKIMESIIKTQLMSYLLDHRLISKHQHAFMSNHSTASNLLECTHDWLLSINDSRTTDVVWIDLSRAFDSIVFEKLLFKLHNYGITGSLFNWIYTFLHNRTQCVIVEHCLSSVINVESGVPQGSVLGPLLFLLFINDIEHVCNLDTKLKLFADDCKLYCTSSVGNSSISLQQCLDVLCEWARLWQLSINILKCFIMTISLSRQLTDHTYYINGTAIANVRTAQDLGVTVSFNLSFKQHIENIVAKSYQRIAILLRGFVTRDINFMCKAYVSFIRPILEYNSVVWSPREIYLIDLLEKVQRHFSRSIPSLSHLTYSDRLSALHMESLELRRLHFDLIYYYKIFHNLTPHIPDDHFIRYYPPVSSRSASSYLIRPRKCCDKLLSYLSFRSIDAWNDLSPDIKSATSLGSFKLAIKRVELTKYLKGSAYKH